MKYQRPKGTSDILPGESQKWQYLEQTAQRVFERFGYQEIRTPIFESYDVFARSSGDSSDIVTKEMYDFEDKGHRKMALRPEGTAGVVRAYIENKLYGPEHLKPYKVYYHGPMFRYERPQSGRQRQFSQFGVEAFGSDSVYLDLEIISMAAMLLKQLGLADYHLALNTLGDPESRLAYHQALIAYLTPLREQLSEDSQRRLTQNPLRILDSKDPQDQTIVAQAPIITDYLTNSARERFEALKQGLTRLGINYSLDPQMVRGLDYYNHTIFEFEVTSPVFNHHALTVLAGGRYDGLVSELGGPEESGIGFGLGMERLLLLLDDQTVKSLDTVPDLFVVKADETVTETAMAVSQAFREAGWQVLQDFTAKKVKGQFKLANRLQARYSLTLGESELSVGHVELKKMSTGATLTVTLADILENAAEIIAKLD